MARERKSPQEKKHLEYTKDHFTGGFDSSRMFPRTWKRKKTHANREYRRKSDDILAQAKPGAAIDDMEVLADDLTGVRFQKSVTRRRLYKMGTITVGEKVKRTLKWREEMVGRRVQRHKHYDHVATSAISTLGSLSDEELVGVARRADLLCRKRNADEVKRVQQSNDPIDRALDFLYSLSCGSGREIDALRRNPALDKELGTWMIKANRILERDKRVLERKIEQKQALREKLRALRYQ